jgi:hypothetical protein
MKHLTLCLLILAAACGKDKSSSNSNVFGSQYGVAQTVDGYVVMPRLGMGGSPYIEAGGRQYQIGQISQMAHQTLMAMQSGQIQPTLINTQIVKFRSRITASTSMYGGGYGGGYPPSGYPQQPINTNMLDIQALQPF